MQNTTCLGGIMPICDKQHLSNIRDFLHYQVKQHWSLVEKCVAYKRVACNSLLTVIGFIYRVLTRIVNRPRKSNNSKT